MQQIRVDGNMKRENESKVELPKKTVFSEKEFLDYLEERFRKLKLEEQKFREEVLAGNVLLEKTAQYTKANG
jgi:hypothetical protein